MHNSFYKLHLIVIHLGAREKGLPQEPRVLLALMTGSRPQQSDRAEAGELRINFPRQSPDEELSFKHFTTIRYSNTLV